MEDEEQTVRLKANYVISAFGSGLTDTSGRIIIMVQLNTNHMSLHVLRVFHIATSTL